MTTNEAGDGNPIGGDRGVEALWVAVEETRQQVAQIRDMLTGANLNVNNSPPVDRTRAEGFARGQPADRRRNQPPCNQPDSEGDSDDEDDEGYGVVQPKSSLFISSPAVSLQHSSDGLLHRRSSIITPPPSSSLAIAICSPTASISSADRGWVWVASDVDLIYGRVVDSGVVVVVWVWVWPCGHWSGFYL
ncbi:hypothetical protein LWI29_009719 [Acer saccharum]|uniref:Uncharacterized protein n=1 Tax=Acer saccharum TaxID=4024 RepID=A0AA39VE20_ACESA|nr:hypothetical protein LWI29_009719 [Acer saccharum]